jgi:outer membrane protein assembly factor BamB
VRTVHEPQALVRGTGSLLTGILVTVLGVSAVAEDWPAFRGADGSGVSTQKKKLPSAWSQDENMAWQVELPGPGTSSPAIYKDRIYVTCYTGYNVPGEAGDMDDLERHLVCLRRDNGREIWRKSVPAELPEQDSIRDDHGYASSTPAVDDERIYVFFGKSGAMAFDHDGEQLWQTPVGDQLHGWGSAASPVVAGNLVYINASVESQSLVALDVKTGDEKWRARGINESWNTPLLVPVGRNRRELVVAIMGDVLGFDPKTGEQLWSCDTDIGWYMVPSLVANEGVVYCIGGRSGGALAVRTGGRGDVTESHRIWTGTKGSNVTSPIYHQGHLYWMNDNQGIAYCAEAETGELVYEERVPRADQVYSSPVLADGKLFYVTRFGRCFVVAAQPSFRLLATNDLEDGSLFHACPVVADGRLYIRSNKRLYCIAGN